MNEQKPNEFSTVLAFLVILLTIVCWMNIGPLISLSLTLIPTLGEDKWILLTEFLFRHIPYVMMFLALFFGSNFVLKTKLRELVRGTGRKLDLKIAAISFALYFFILGLFSLFSYKTIEIDPASYKEKLLFVLPVLLLTPIQTISEELFFRAIPARLLYHNELPHTIKSYIPLSLVSGLIFLIPHLGNPEVLKSGDGMIAVVYYFLWGFLSMALALYTDGFEIPIAMHMANNIYAALIVNYTNSALPTKAIFINRSGDNSLLLLFEAIVIYVIFFAFAYALKRKNYFESRN